MTIEDGPAYIDSLPDWAMLHGCFPGKIKPTDIDGMVEIRGRFLVLEQKTGHGMVKQGQHIMFAAFAKQHRGNMVIAFHREFAWLRCYVHDDFYASGWPCLEMLRAYVQLWVRAACQEREIDLSSNLDFRFDQSILAYMREVG